MRSIVIRRKELTAVIRALCVISTNWVALAATLAGATLLAVGDASAQYCSSGYCSNRRELPAEPNKDWRRDFLKPNNRLLTETETCNITRDIAVNWAKQSSQLRVLQEAFRDAYETFDDAKRGVPIEMFGPKDSVESELLRSEAKEELGQKGADLLRFAYKYATRQSASCQSCFQFDTWGSIGDIAQNYSGGKIGDLAWYYYNGRNQFINFKEGVTGDIFKHHPIPQQNAPQRQPETINFKSLTLAQIEDDNVKAQLKNLMTLLDNIQRLPTDTPPDLNSTKAELAAYQAAQEKCVMSNRPAAASTVAAAPPGAATPASTPSDGGSSPVTTATTAPVPSADTVLAVSGLAVAGYDPRLCTQSMLRPFVVYSRNQLVDALVAARNANPGSPTMISLWEEANTKKLGCTSEDPSEFRNLKWIKELVPN